MLPATEVTLIDGETVQLALESTCFQDQHLVRLGPRLIAGIVAHAVRENLYLWREVDGVYRYLGDIVFDEQADGSVLWNIFVWTGTSSEFQQRAARALADQCRSHARPNAAGNHVAMLSAASRTPA